MSARPNDNHTRIFISHKGEDKELALEVCDVLKGQCSHLETYLSGRDFGDDWRSTIENRLAESDLLPLLFTAPAKGWDWPLYEVGLFAGNRDDARPPARSCICMRVPSGRRRCITASEPLYPTHRIVLGSSVGPDEPIDSPGDRIPRHCQVERATPPAIAIFGLADVQGRTWGDLLDAMTEEEEWKSELDEQYARALAGKTAYPTRSTFRGSAGLHDFRAMLTRLERAETRVVRVSITFVPEFTPSVVGGPAFNLLRLATRFQYEVVKRYQGKLELLHERTFGDRVLPALLGRIRSIEKEAEAFGYLHPANVQQVFPDTGEVRRDVSKMFDEFERIKAGLDEVVRAQDLVGAERLLDMLACMNARFLRDSQCFLELHGGRGTRARRAKSVHRLHG